MRLYMSSGLLCSSSSFFLIVAQSSSECGMYSTDPGVFFQPVWLHISGLTISPHLHVYIPSGKINCGFGVVYIKVWESVKGDFCSLSCGQGSYKWNKKWGCDFFVVVCRVTSKTSLSMMQTTWNTTFNVLDEHLANSMKKLRHIYRLMNPQLLNANWPLSRMR